MKLQNIEISNTLGIKGASISMKAPVMLIAGRNGAGKSSIAEAVRHALTGEHERVDLKKEFPALLHGDAKSGSVALEFDSGAFTLALPSGSMEASAQPMPDALRFCIDPARFAALDENARRAFLFKLMGIKVTGDAVRERLAKRGCDAEKAGVVLPLLAAGFDAAATEAKAKARDAKAAWRAVTGETYGANKAESWAAATPEYTPPPEGYDYRQALDILDIEIEKAAADLGELQGRAASHEGRAGKIEELREKAGKFARIQDKLNRDVAELADWQAKVAETRAMATSSVRFSFEAPCPSCGEVLVMVGTTEKDSARGDNYQPALQAKSEAMTHDKGGDPEAAAKLPEYEKALKLIENAVANGKRDLAAADAAAQALKAIEVEADQHSADPMVIEAAKEKLAERKDRRRSLADEAQQHREARRKHEEATRKTEQAAQHHADVGAWEKIADALAPDGIPAEFLADALGPFNERLKLNAGAAAWPIVSIDGDMQIRLDGRQYRLRSESERWRADAMIAEVIAHFSGARFLMLDRFDVLDGQGRADCLYWLGEMAALGNIDSALVLGTLKALPAELPDHIGAVWVESGMVNNQERAAA